MMYLRTVSLNTTIDALEHVNKIFQKFEILLSGGPAGQKGNLAFKVSCHSQLGLYFSPKYKGGSKSKGSQFFLLPPK